MSPEFDRMTFPSVFAVQTQIKTNAKIDRCKKSMRFVPFLFGLLILIAPGIPPESSCACCSVVRNQRIFYASRMTIAVQDIDGSPMGVTACTWGQPGGLVKSASHLPFAFIVDVENKRPGGRTGDF